MFRWCIRPLLWGLTTLGLNLPSRLSAEHFTGYSLTYEWVGVNALGINTYDIILDLYLECCPDCAPLVPNGHELKFERDCGPTFEIRMQDSNVEFSVEVSPLCASEVGSSQCNGGTLPGYMWHRMRRRVSLQACDSWRISWSACCRRESVNLLNGFTPGMYADIVFNNVAGPEDSSPTFVDAGVPHMCVNQPISYNPGVTDPDGNTMAFSLISARTGTPSPLDLVYQPGYTGTAPVPGISINPSTGQLNFVPTVSGMYVLVVQVSTYTPGGQLISTVMRDLMFMVMPCDQGAPYSAGFTQVTPGLTVGPNSLGPCSGQPFCVQMTFYDTNPAETIEVISNAQSLLPSSSFNVVGTNPAVATFCWTGNPSQLPVNVYVEATDGSCPIPNVSSRSIFIEDCGSELPVRLLAFSATPASSKVRVEWTTASEQDNAYFTVERGRTPLDLTAIGTVDGAGTSHALLQYVFYDSDPLPGLSYYRLKQTDLDGTVSYSEVAPVSFISGGGIRVVPDGTGHGWMISLDMPLTGEWLVVDMLGRVMLTGKTEDASMLSITAPTMAQGIGVLILRSAYGDHRVKLPPLGGPGSLTGM